MRGQIHAILGKSGIGKSTLLYILGTLDRPTSGQYFYKQKPVEYEKKHQEEHLKLRRSFGFIFQNYCLIKHLNVTENILLPTMYHEKNSKTTKDHAQNLIQLLDLEPEINKKPHQLSGGQMQRVCIARALINQPDVIFADEPTGALDEHNTAIVMNMFKKINQTYGTTIVMVTHDQDCAQKAHNQTLLQSKKMAPHDLQTEKLP